MEFKRLSDIQLQTVSKDWLSQADQHPVDVIRDDYEAVLKHLQSIHGNADPSSVWAVIDGDENALALTLLHHARPESTSPWLKMLRIYLMPDLDVDAANAELDLEHLARIASVAVVGGLQSTFEEYPSNTLKVYSRTPLDGHFLSGVLVENETLEVLGIRVVQQGAWVVLENPVAGRERQ